ncbi:hypothetical protein BHE74_00048768 [Ensete ventricosum]|nr:hypothetical protein BHE74_00048768 [Ensete ventricosum]
MIRTRRFGSDLWRLIDSGPLFLIRKGAILSLRSTAVVRCSAGHWPAACGETSCEHRPPPKGSSRPRQFRLYGVLQWLSLRRIPPQQVMRRRDGTLGISEVRVATKPRGLRISSDHSCIEVSPFGLPINLFDFVLRYFLADTILEEMTFGWPRQKADFKLREQLALNLQYAVNSVQTPQLLLLDEPLAGLDWKARADVVKLLKHLKKELTILVISHDLNSILLLSLFRELSSLVDISWRMQMGGILKEEALPL